jgi:CubicO group peptidase (beta-lactamase class C family)
MFKQIISLLIATLSILYIFIFSSHAGHNFDEKKQVLLPYISPASIGWSNEKLFTATQFAQKIGSAAVIGLYDGKVFLSWGSVNRKYRCHSIWKPFLGALYGIYVHKGLIDLSSSLDDLQIDDIVPGLSETEKTATVSDLLKSRSGVYHLAAAGSDAMQKKRPKRNAFLPGAHFFYNNWDFNTLITIFERQTGETVCNAFYEQIAKPIGMFDFRTNDCSARHEPEKSMHPSLYIRMTANDMARFAILIQQYGNWNNHPIIPKQWIEESTNRYSIIDHKTGEGYGYLWRILPSFGNLGRVIFHTGHGVHLMAIFPEEKLAIIHRVDTETNFRIKPAEVEVLVHMILDARMK